VTFAYEERRGQLHNLSFCIRPGEFVAIVGPSGGGKTTILDLIMRLYEPDQGQVLLNGEEIKKYRLSEIRNKITMVSQDFFLFNRSIRDNLLYVNPSASQQELDTVCQTAQILTFIQQLPDRFDTLIGERGIKLSGGEKQRLSIARALLRDAQMILMDEPTSQLDGKTEAQLMENLRSIFKRKTLIIVAHRLSTIIHANKIIVIKDGRVVEKGNHTELVAKHGFYQELIQKQQANILHYPQ
jgi:ABC-type multidrug transport system fused ATPase/permease subunit